MQPTHATSDMPWAEERVGPERIAGAYAWRRMLDAARGSRWAGTSRSSRSIRASACMPPSPAPDRGRAGRRLASGGEADRVEALRGFTLDAAYAGFAEAEVGSLAVGKRADFVLLKEDPLTIDPAKLRDLTVQATYVDGRVVYRAGDRVE